MFTRRLRFMKDFTEVRRDENAPGKAVALGYDAGKNAAPVILAAGKGELAERILALGKEHGVPVIADPALAAALAEVDVGTMIPPELYAVVAEVLAYVYRIKSRR